MMPAPFDVLDNVKKKNYIDDILSCYEAIMRSFINQLLLDAFPRRTYTALLGKLVQLKVSARFIPWYVKKFEIDTSELDRPVSDYASLGAFFSRTLQPATRPVVGQISSPVDGTVSTCGEIVDDTLFQVKGLPYSLRKLLGSDEEARYYNGGMYLTLYLSPRDYHRIHAPLNCKATFYRHIPGTLFPVNQYGVTHIDGLFVKNERTVTEFETDNFHFTMVKVGAAGVGTVITPYVPVRINRDRSRGQIQEGLCNDSFQRGQEIGYFSLGSTVVLVFPRAANIALLVHPGDKLKMGQEIAQFVDV